MGTNTKIEWADHTHNFWVGCHKVSLGCVKCYMFREMERFGQNPNIVRRVKNFDAPIKWLKNGKAKPGDRIFVNSFSDFFIEEAIAQCWILDAMDVIEQTPDLNYLILTKRSENLSFFPHYPTNVWLGVSIENPQVCYRHFDLIQTNAKIKWISFEPLLDSFAEYPGILDEIDWAVIGGESDYKKPRPMKMEWALDLINQSQQNGIPVFLKQLGGTKKIGGTWGGNQINSKTWQEFPILK